MGKNVVLTGGGTAGHVYPALALAEKLISDGHQVYFAGTPNSIESRIVPESGIEFKSFESGGFDRAHPASLVKGVSKILKSTRKAKKWFKDVKPDVVVSFGGYVSIPVARAAEECGVPVIVHEQNSVMGMANKYISKNASAVCLTYDAAAAYVPEGVECQITGNPVRESVTSTTKEEGRRYLDVPENDLVLTVFGGSRGARHINDAICALKRDLLAIDGLYIVHITGPDEYDRTLEELDLSDEDALRWKVVSYENEMPKVLSASDMVVSRAGATSLAEISAKCVPAILVPYPYATADHQTTNARSYAASGAAIVVPDNELDSKDFKEAVLSVASDASVREKMTQSAKELDQADAASALAKVVESHF